MYDYIKGKLISKNDPNIVVECGGIGYLMLTNSRTTGILPDAGEEVKVYTKLIHKEDAMLLCGFAHKEDRVIFDILTCVSGIGTKVALTLLDEFGATELIGAVIEGDYKLISRAKGVGPKLAQKIILELKDKLTSTHTAAQIIMSKAENIGGADGVDGTKVSNGTIEEVQVILNSLGYSQSEYSNAIEAALKSLEKDDSQELLRISLKILSQAQ